MKTIVAHNLRKQFKHNCVLDNVCFTAVKGSVFGIIGPDGAGKSTLIRILATLMTPDSGDAEILGLSLRNNYKILRRHIGYMPETFSLYQDLTVEENLEFYASLFNTPVRENYDVIAPVFSQLKPFGKRRAGKLSGGMKQKLALSCALIHQPDILLMDEPTRGVDPVSRTEFWNIIQNIKKKGITIVLSTSYMDEANLCDQIGLFNHGHFLEIDSPSSIIARFTDPLYAIRSENPYSTLLKVRQWQHTKSCYTFGDSIHMLPDSPEADINCLHSFIPDAIIERTTPTVEDCFMVILNQ